MTNQNKNVNAGEVLRAISYQMAAEGIIRDPLAELKQARARIAEMETRLNATKSACDVLRMERDDWQAKAIMRADDNTRLLADLRACQRERDQFAATLADVRCILAKQEGNDGST
jgi:hypothetical protein